MNAHPGGLDFTLRMISVANLTPESRVLDLGAGDGSTARLLQDMGYDAQGMDLLPRGEGVRVGNLLDTELESESFDAVISECTFWISGDVAGALRESRRLLRPGGLLLWSDVFFTDAEGLLQTAGFTVFHLEDLTELWKEYYLAALWRGDELCCELPRGKCRYLMLIAGKD